MENRKCINQEGDKNSLVLFKSYQEKESWYLHTEREDMEAR